MSSRASKAYISKVNHVFAKLQPFLYYGTQLHALHYYVVLSYILGFFQEDCN